MKKGIIFFGLLMVILFSGLAFGYSVGGVPGWSYRRPITINPQTPDNDFQVKVELNPCNFNYSQCQSGGEDVRFTSDSGGNNVLSYWIENWNTSGTSTIWVKVASAGTTKIYMFYGNPGASSASDADSTFVFFDDFEEGNLNKWTKVIDTFWTVGTDQKRSGTYSMKAGITSSSTKYIVATGVNTSDLVFDSWWYCTATSPDISAGFRSSSTTPLNNYEINWEGQWSIAKYVNGSWTRLNAVSGSLPQYTWFKVTIIIQGSPGQMKFLLNDAQVNPSSGWLDVGTDHSSGTIALKAWTASNNWWVDDVRVRKYADPEPTTELSIDFQYQKQIVIDASKVEANLTDFPVLIYLASDSDLASKAQDDGDDIMFSDSAGNKLSHEIEYFNGTTGELVAWVKADLSASTDTILYMYYGNSTACSQQDVSSVWDSNYKGVWHLSEASGTYSDSTANNKDSTSEAPNSRNNDGVAGRAPYFTDSSEYINFPDTINDGEFTVELWFKPDWNGNDNANHALLDLTKSPIYFFIGKDSANNLKFYFESADDADVQINYGVSSAVTSANWYYVVGTGKFSSSGPHLMYLDGSQVGSSTITVNYKGTLASSMRLGSPGDTYMVPQGPADAVIDEVRISNTVRTAAWIKTSYNNLSSPSTFFTLGTEQTVIDLSYFRAKSLYNKVVLKWGTTSEIDNEGFNILRSEKENGEYFQINPFIIPSRGEAGLGAEYSYTDINVINGIKYYYYLEDIDIYGRKSLHGPVAATPNDITLFWPEEGDSISPDSFYFSWRSSSYHYFKVDLSFKAGFPDSETLSFPKDGWISTQYLWLRPEQGTMIWRRTQLRGGRLFWRVRAKGKDGHIAYSDSRELIFEKLPHLEKKQMKKKSPIKKKNLFSDNNCLSSPS